MSTMSAAAGASPARMHLANLATADEIEVEYNPAELSEELVVSWQRLAIMGQSYEQMQYTGTKNHRPTFDLAFDALTQRGSGYDIARARRFLLSLCYPSRAGNDVRSGAPPRALFVWPNFMSMMVQVASVRFKHSRFALDGTPTYFTASLEIEEVRDVRLFSEDVLANGTQRPGLGLPAAQSTPTT